MSWTDPSSHIWAVAELVTAANMNTFIQANLTVIGGAWTAYTPATFTNLTGQAGNFASKQIDKTLMLRATFTAGTTTSGAPSFSLPAGTSALGSVPIQALAITPPTAGSWVAEVLGGAPTVVVFGIFGGTPPSTSVVNATVGGTIQLA